MGDTYTTFSESNPIFIYRKNEKNEKVFLLDAQSKPREFNSVVDIMNLFGFSKLEELEKNNLFLISKKDLNI